MNLESAITHMVSGDKVRLPEWEGYWFIDQEAYSSIIESNNNTLDAIRVFTKNGEVLDTPHFDKYGSREDWEVVIED